MLDNILIKVSDMLFNGAEMSKELPGRGYGRMAEIFSLAATQADGVSASPFNIEVTQILWHGTSSRFYMIDTGVYRLGVCSKQKIRERYL